MGLPGDGTHRHQLFIPISIRPSPSSHIGISSAQGQLSSPPITSTLRASELHLVSWLLFLLLHWSRLSPISSDSTASSTTWEDSYTATPNQFHNDHVTVPWWIVLMSQAGSDHQTGVLSPTSTLQKRALQPPTRLYVTLNQDLVADTPPHQRSNMPIIPWSMIRSCLRTRIVIHSSINARLQRSNSSSLFFSVISRC
jgi:hypothetical protein